MLLFDFDRNLIFKQLLCGDIWGVYGGSHRESIDFMVTDWKPLNFWAD